MYTGFMVFKKINAKRLEYLPATPEQIKRIASETPCVTTLFREKLNADHNTDNLLSLREAKSMAIDCMKREELIAIKKEREDRMNVTQKMQLDALNDVN